MFHYECKWGLLRCWGDKFLGKYENDRYIVVNIWKLGLHYGLQTKKGEGFKLGACIGWVRGMEPYGKLMIGRWEFVKQIFVA